jgi:undecaprenyl-diphosphatase
MFIAHIVTLDAGDVPIGDTAAYDMAVRLEVAPLVTVAKVVSVLGALPVVSVLVLGAIGFLLSRRDIADSIVLAVGLVLTYAAVHITKAATDRLRPPDPLVSTDLSAYPSGHAAYAIAWVAVAVTLSRVLPGLASRFAIVTVAIVVAIAVGVSRVYLRTHWLSDVTGGAGLAAALFSLLGLIALVVVHVRDNGRRQSPARSTA